MFYLVAISDTHKCQNIIVQHNTVLPHLASGQFVVLNNSEAHVDKELATLAFLVFAHCYYNTLNKLNQHNLHMKHNKNNFIQQKRGTYYNIKLNIENNRKKYSKCLGLDSRTLEPRAGRRVCQTPIPPIATAQIN